MNDININDNSYIFSEIFKNFKKEDQKENILVKFVSTEKWLEQLGRRITS
tara:strand:+ start:673 stop:822 length:150 start_codon:yes stop_codon:yes gene_type:complete